MTTQVSEYSIRFLKREYTVPAQAILLVIALAAILLRLLSSLYQGNTVTVLPGIYDQISYDSLARRVVEGYGFSFAEDHWPLTRAGEPTAHWSFLYTIFLASLYALFGPQPLIARLVQAMVVGGLQTYLLYHIGKKTFSRGVGIVAAGLAAFYIYFIYYSSALMTEPFYITAILYSLYAAMQMSEDNSRPAEIKLGIALGISLAITVLLRQVFLLFIPFLLLWIWMVRFRRRLGMPWLSTILSLGLVIVSILPISLYNQSRFGRFVLLNTNSGYAFFWGNHPIYGTRFIPILPADMPSYQELIPEEVRHLDEAALDQELLRRGVHFIVEDPRRYILLSLSRIPEYFMFWPSAGSGIISNISRVASFGILLPFMLYGLFLAWWKSSSRGGNRLVNLLISPAGLLILFALVYTSIHILTWALIRYRLPVDAVMIPFAALALCDLVSRFDKKADPASLKTLS